jgi:hypothetical protein
MVFMSPNIDDIVEIPARLHPAWTPISLSPHSIPQLVTRNSIIRTLHWPLLGNFVNDLVWA